MALANLKNTIEKTKDFSLKLAACFHFLINHPEAENAIGIRMISHQKFVANSGIFACFLGTTKKEVLSKWKAHGYTAEGIFAPTSGLSDPLHWRVRQIPRGLLTQNDRNHLRSRRCTLVVVHPDVAPLENIVADFPEASLFVATS
jgi:hypothetical protein